MEKCSDKMESSFTLFDALKIKNLNKGGKTCTNGVRHTNNIMVTLSHVATPLVVIDKKIQQIWFDQPSLAF